MPSGKTKPDSGSPEQADTLARLETVFRARPQDWKLIGNLLVEAKAQNLEAPAQTWLAYANFAAGKKWHDKAFEAATEAAASAEHASQAWRLAFQIGIDSEGAARTAEAVKNLLMISPANDRYLRQAVKAFRAKGPTPGSTLIVREAAPYLRVDEELIRYSAYVEDSPELAAKLKEWASTIPTTASPTKSLDALSILLELGIEPPPHLATNVLDNPDENLNDRQRLRALLRAYDHAGQREAAVEIYRRFAETPGREGLLIRFLPYCRSVPGLPEHLLAWAREAGPDSTDWRRKAALKIFGFFGMEAPAGLMPGDESDHKLQRAWQLWAAHVPTDAELKRPVMTSYSGEEIVLSPAGKPAPVLIVFSGLSDNFSVPPPTFDRFLAALGASAIFMSDRNRLCFAAGSKGMGLNFDQTIAYLREKLAELQCTRLVTLGTSAGGYAALLYGLNMRAHSVLGFGSVTNATPEYLSTDPRGRLVAKRAARQVEPKNLDVRPMIVDPANTTDVHLYYGEGMEVDSRNSKHLEGLPRVALHPVMNFDRHQVLPELVVRGEFQGILEKALYG